MNEPGVEAEPSEGESEAPDSLALPAHLGIRVKRGRVPARLTGCIAPQPWIQVTRTEALVSFPGVRMLVHDGSEVTVDLTDAEGIEAQWLVQGLGVQLAALQRGQISLHAATVRVGGIVVAISGRTGSGKSTTALGIAHRGHQLLTDDVTLLGYLDGELWTTPYTRSVHVSSDAADRLGLDFDSMPRVARWSDKGILAGGRAPAEPLRIGFVVVLHPVADPESPQGWEREFQSDGSAGVIPAVHAIEVRGALRLGALMDQTILDGIAPAVLGHESFFEQLARLADSVPVYVLTRPRQGWTLDQVVDSVEELAESRR